MQTLGGSYRVVLLALEHMSLVNFSGPLQTLTTSRRFELSDAPRYQTIVASETGGWINTSSGVSIFSVSLASLGSLPIDTIIVPGSCRRDGHAPDTFIVQWIARRAPAVRRLCSVGDGAFFLGAAGQLAGRRVATHRDWAARLVMRYPATRVVTSRSFVHDGAIWSASGGLAGIDMALALIAEDFGDMEARSTASNLMKRSQETVERSRTASGAPAKRRLNEEFQAWMRARLREDLSVTRLAQQARMAPRKFTRAFVAAYGCTPAKAVTGMRLEEACHKLTSTSLPLERIAVSVGYRGEQALRRVFNRELGISAAEYRRHCAHIPPI